jgi:hypothetical protein
LLVIDKFTDENYNYLKNNNFELNENIIHQVKLTKQSVQDKLKDIIHNSQEPNEIAININFKENEYNPVFETIAYV